MTIAIRQINSAYSVINAHLETLKEKGIFDTALKQLPSYVNPTSFLNAARSQFLTNPESFLAHKRSLVEVIMKAARDGLLLDGREASAVVFKGKLSYIPMVEGVKKRLANQCSIKKLIATCVYEEDEFEFRRSTKNSDFIRHVPNLRGPQENIICAYAIAFHQNGSSYSEVITKKYIDKVKSSSQAKFSDKSPWSQWYEQMAIKTAIHCLAKNIPNTPSYFSNDEEEIEASNPAIQEVDAEKATHVLKTIEELTARYPQTEPTDVQIDIEGDTHAE